MRNRFVLGAAALVCVACSAASSSRTIGGDSVSSSAANGGGGQASSGVGGSGGGVGGSGESPTCFDGLRNGEESDVDCGGATCAPCDTGRACAVASDCESGVCTAGKCAPPSCFDDVKNGLETAADCGGDCPLKCPDGKGCVKGTDCASGVCDNGLCKAGSCGDGVVHAGEGCDDGNALAFDSCSTTCQLPAGHLLLTEFAVAPTAAEFVEIVNPTKKVIDLANVYLADHSTYYEITQGKAPSSTDFVVRFPAGAQLAPGAFAVIGLHAASDFKASWGAFPTYDLSVADAGAPTMVGSVGSQAGLTDSGEMLVLFQWDGLSSTVKDIDYVAYGATGDKADKSSVAGYKADTAAALQVAAAAPATKKSSHRCPTSEDGEIASGGNGILGHDETSESGKASWKTVDSPSPGASAVVCP